MFDVLYSTVHISHSLPPSLSLRSPFTRLSQCHRHGNRRREKYLWIFRSPPSLLAQQLKMESGEKWVWLHKTSSTYFLRAMLSHPTMVLLKAGLTGNQNRSSLTENSVANLPLVHKGEHQNLGVPNSGPSKLTTSTGALLQILDPMTGVYAPGEIRGG